MDGGGGGSEGLRGWRFPWIVWSRYGIRAFDTSAYYGPSEIVLGGVLKALRDEFPRESYKLVTEELVASWSLQGADEIVL